MKKPFQVLSIDFDFFQDTTKEQLADYPDGIDLPSGISTIVWASHYAIPSSKQKIKQVTINQTLYEQITQILQNQSADIPVMITNSHVHAYDFIKKHYDNRDIKLVNIDFHHDITNDNKTLDCGNWISHVIKDLKLKHYNFTWIARALSLECYDFKQGEIDGLHTELDFESIKDTKFDAVFLCRSDIWSPPHLDNYFNNLVNTCSNHFYDIVAEQNVMKPRDMSKIIKAEETIRQQIKNNQI